MGSIQRSGNKWRVQVYVARVRDSTTKHTKQEAAKWVPEREAELRPALGAAVMRLPAALLPQRSSSCALAISTV
ncbi:hypothetical protein B9Y66_16350 [Stenotrophomonas maltophilia]|nr:hypothetical protein B9Y66_16350 [Stenotrophomonas maltophilia]